MKLFTKSEVHGTQHNHFCTAHIYGLSATKILGDLYRPVSTASGKQPARSEARLTGKELGQV